MSPPPSGRSSTRRSNRRSEAQRGDSAVLSDGHTSADLRGARISADSQAGRISADSQPGHFSVDSQPVSFPAALLQWYDVHKRDLPWRRNRDPYRIWVSEIMLQQTRVEAVIPFYERFLERFPTPQALAAATEEEVLASWSGLGYYSRARNLWRGAAMVCDRFGGQFPLDRETALQLPGIGRYTSAAIVSIAADQPHAVVDGNVARVLARLFALEPPADRSIPKLESIANDLLSPDRAGDHNQAMMELGATVCTPRAPRCPSCPVRSMCAMIPDRDPESYPRPVPRKETVQLELAILLLRDSRGRLLLERGRWNLIPHLWIPPVVSLSTDVAPARADAKISARRSDPLAAIESWNSSSVSSSASVKSRAKTSGARTQSSSSAEPAGSEARTRVVGARAIGSFRHSITHHRIRFAVWSGTIIHAPNRADYRLATDAELDSIGLSSVALKALRLENAPRRQFELL